MFKAAVGFALACFWNSVGSMHVQEERNCSVWLLIASSFCETAAIAGLSPLSESQLRPASDSLLF